MGTTMRKTVKKTETVRKTTRRAGSARKKPVERRISAKRLIPRLELLEGEIDAFKRRPTILEREATGPTPGFALSDENTAPEPDAEVISTHEAA
jgi:hypothetical protein